MFVRAAEQECKSLNALQMHRDGDISLTCLDLRDELRDKELSQKLLRDREMVEEVEKNEKYRQENLEQQADILEELLLESTVSGTPSPNPR